MPPRRNKHGALTAADLASNLPERFHTPVAKVEHGQPTGLAEYMADLDKHLTELCGPRRTGVPSAVEVMHALGVPPSEWYRAALSK